MNSGFYIILAAQFLSALADNALLFAAIALLNDLSSPAWHTPVLQQSFIISYIVLAPFVGAFADSLPKGRVMFISNIIKLAGCLAMLIGVHPLIAYCLVGLGAAAYSPAKYGILTEYLPPDQLVKANSWMEGLTVAAIVLGAIVGGILISPAITAPLLQTLDTPLIGSIAELAIAVIVLIYIVAAIVNLYIPHVAIDHKPLSRSPVFWPGISGTASNCCGKIRSDRYRWRSRRCSGAQAPRCACWCWLGSRCIALRHRRGRQAHRLGGHRHRHRLGAGGEIRQAGAFGKGAAVGIAMGVVVLMMIPVTNSTLAILLLIAIGAMGGYFVVPMNALLQHRGHLLMGAGRSIAVQNFNENLSIFAMLGLYAVMQKLDLSIYLIIPAVFGLLLSGIMAALYRKARARPGQGTKIRQIQSLRNFPSIASNSSTGTGLLNRYP